MKEWNRALALLLATGMAVGLCGCNGAAEPSSVLKIVYPAVLSEAPALEPTPEPTSEPTPEPTPTPKPELHGLVLAEYVSTNGTYVVHCLNPETGEAMVLSRFVPSDGSKLNPGRVKWTDFSDDFSKMVCVRSGPHGGDCAGWIDTNGNFFDVTGALGLSTGTEFEPKSYSPVGFSNGFFGFSTLESNSTCYYYVPVDNITPNAVQEGDVRTVGYPYTDGPINPYADVPRAARRKYILEGTQYKMPKYTPDAVTSWIDETHCIVNAGTDFASSTDSVIIDVQAQTETYYIPGNSRVNWGGMVSPDRTEIVFLSQPKGSYDTDVYIIPINGGDPVKVTGNSFSLGEMYNIAGNFGLIGWI